MIKELKPPQSIRLGLSNEEFRLEMHAGVPADYIKFNSDKIPFSAPRLMPNDACEVSVAVSERHFRADRKSVADNRTHSVSGEVINSSELFQRRSVLIPSQHD